MCGRWRSHARPGQHTVHIPVKLDLDLVRAQLVVGPMLPNGGVLRHDIFQPKLRWLHGAKQGHKDCPQPRKSTGP